jgi:hypothetical protein
MGKREKLLDAIDTAARAELDYLAGHIDYRAMTRAMDHVAVCRDAANLSFFKLVRVPERALAGGV